MCVWMYGRGVVVVRTVVVVGGGAVVVYRGRSHRKLPLVFRHSYGATQLWRFKMHSSSSDRKRKNLFWKIERMVSRKWGKLMARIREVHSLTFEFIPFHWNSRSTNHHNVPFRHSMCIRCHNFGVEYTYTIQWYCHTVDCPCNRDY